MTQTINIHEAKTHLSRLIDQAVRGEPFVIAKAGKPLVKVMALTSPEPSQVKRLGFMVGQITVPDDFDQMGWHDCRIHGFAFGDNYRLLLDIDYIFAWVNPCMGEVYYSFWVSPCTLVFENVFDLNIHAEDMSMEILSLTREDAGKPLNAEFIGRDQQWKWLFECTAGEIELTAVGYTQYVRAQPKHISEQHFALEERGGVSFAEKAIVLSPPL